MINFEQKRIESLKTFKKLDKETIDIIVEIWIEKNQLTNKDLYTDALIFFIESIHIIPWTSITFNFFEIKDKITLTRYFQVDGAQGNSMKGRNKINWFHTDGNPCYTSIQKAGDTIHIENASIIIEIIKTKRSPVNYDNFIEFNIWEQKTNYIKGFIEYIQTELYPFH